MRAYGSDRVRVDGESIILSSRVPRQWKPRVARTLTSAEFPGTAVLWNDQCFEVVEVTPLPNGGVQYLLEPWRDQNAMRFTDTYSADNEVARAAEWRASLGRERKRKSANALGLLTGHLPAVMQNRMAEELGVVPVRLTILSTIGTFAVIAALVLWIVSGMMRNTPRPLPVFVVTFYLAIETAFRFNVAWLLGRPIGSPAGLIAYLIYYVFIADRTRAVSPFATEKGTSVASSAPPEDVALRDALLVREPLITLLTPAEQARIAERYGYDYRRQSFLIAGLILFFAILGIISSIAKGARLSLLIAVVLACEQLIRLTILRHGPAGSIFGFLARPFVRKLL